MSQKKILIVSSYFYPENTPRAFRATALATQFARQGHDVTVITLKKDDIHEPFAKKHNITIKDMGKLKFPDINLSRNKMISIFQRIVKRGALTLFEYPEVELMFKAKSALKGESGYDLLISVAAPHPIHWGVAWAWNKKNPVAKTWVADCGDPYMGITLDTFKKLFYFKYLEKWFCKNADYITVPIKGAIGGYYPEFHDKINVIPQGFDFDQVNIDKQAYSPNPTPTFGYAGGLIPGGRDPGPLLEYLVSIKKDFKFILYTKSLHLIEPYLKRAKGRIEIRDYIPREELLQELAKMDFLININNNTNLQLPSKLIDYYLTGRPILSMASGTVDKEAVDQFLERNYEAQYKFDNVDQYRIENVTKQFLDLQDTKE